MEEPQVIPEAFPAQSNQVQGNIDGIPTEAAVLYFEDKILVTLSQGGSLSQWIQVPLSAPSAASVDMALADASLLPLTHLTPKTLLGGGGEDRESLGQLYAVQIASHIVRRDSTEKRMLVVGLGIPQLKPEREAFFDVIELVQKVMV
ncbi:uncharacterized protein B0I36DRAFT_361659 [Microdochium trichocladiopsis]|uniref:Proteasome assembly chaperone 3 n=1 Tax=Microdochium trichocladiopsis TaxID=1682393 RepID=A0A9P8Y872_9PEZI|nr:uncharacterized protein B0I36DRAFT_361659 [Microdochium trichocladiopsis]KAH7032912.1 hypothetical protein B0I36DRAFT_361659 [Microdochium trichocladiopsis]